MDPAPSDQGPGRSDLPGPAARGPAPSQLPATGAVARHWWQHIGLVAQMRGYRLRDLTADSIAAILITATAIPLGVGFASAAGLPPIVGLYTSMLPLVMFGIFASTRHVKLGLDAAAAAMISSTIVPVATVAGVTDQGLLLALVSLVTLLTGAILVIAGAARAGFLADLLSLPLLVGYQAGIALSVIIGQLPKMLGNTGAGTTDLDKLWHVATTLGTTHWPTLALSIGSLLLLVVARRYFPQVPGALVVLILATAVSWIFGFPNAGVAVIGELPSGLPAFALPDFSLLRNNAEILLGTAASLALVVASDVIIASRTFAVRGHYRVSANADITALGLAQLAGSVSGAVTASASYTRTAISEHSKSRTQLSSVLAGLLMAVVVATLTGVLAHVPLAVLGAICVEVCWHLVDGKAFVRLWRLRRADLVIAVLTGLLVLATDPLLAIGVAVTFSVLTFLRKAIWPDESRLGRRAGIGGWYPLDDFTDAKAPNPAVVVYEWNAPLIFANANGFHDKVLGECQPEVRLLVIDCAAIFDVDPSAVGVLYDLADELKLRDVELVFAEPPHDVAEMLQRSGLLEHCGPGPHAFVDVDTALSALGQGPPLPGHLCDPNGDGVYEYVRGTPAT